MSKLSSTVPKEKYEKIRRLGEQLQCASCNFVGLEKSFKLCHSCNPPFFESLANLKKKAVCTRCAQQKHAELGHNVVDFLASTRSIFPSKLQEKEVVSKTTTQQMSSLKKSTSMKEVHPKCDNPQCSVPNGSSQPMFYMVSCKHYLCQSCLSEDSGSFETLCVVCHTICDSVEVGVLTKPTEMEPKTKRARPVERLQCKSCTATGSEQEFFMCLNCDADKATIKEVALCGRCTILHHMNQGHRQSQLYPYFKNTRFTAVSEERNVEVGETKKRDERMNVMKTKTDACIAKCREVSDVLMELAEEAESTADCELLMERSQKLTKTETRDGVKWENWMQQRLTFHEAEANTAEKWLVEAKKMQSKSDV